MWGHGHAVPLPFSSREGMGDSRCSVRRAHRFPLGRPDSGWCARRTLRTALECGGLTPLSIAAERNPAASLRDPKRCRATALQKGRRAFGVCRVLRAHRFPSGRPDAGWCGKPHPTNWRGSGGPRSRRPCGPPYGLVLGRWECLRIRQRTSAHGAAGRTPGGFALCFPPPLALYLPATGYARWCGRARSCVSVAELGSGKPSRH